jgi:hypothetical protein
MTRGLRELCQGTLHGTARIPGLSACGLSTGQAGAARAFGPAAASQRDSPSAWAGVGVAVDFTSSPTVEPPPSQLT